MGPPGAEAAAHVSRLSLAKLPPDHVVLQLDFKNVLNSIRRDMMLETAKQFVPEIFTYTC